MNIGQTLLGVFNWVFAQGAPVIVPVSILILGLIFRAPFKRTLLGALRMGVGFTALLAMIGIIFTALGPPALAIASKVGLDLTITDVGWPALTGIVFSLPWAMTAIALFILLNAVLVGVGVVKTLNVDFFNHWLYVFYIFAVQVATGNWVISIVVGVILWFVTLKIADWIYPMLNAYYDMPLEGISIPHTFAVLWAPVGFLLDKLWDSIPVIKDIRLDPETIRQRWGLFGEPVFIGWVIGLLVGVIGFFELPITGAQIGSAISLAFTVAFFMLILPRASELIVMGMAPLSEAIRAFVTKRMPGRDFYLGLDVAVLVGAPEHVALGILTTPLAFLVALVLPGNRMLPLGDVAGLFIFICVFLLNTNRGNLFRGILNSVLILIPVSLWIGTVMSPTVMEMAATTGYALPEGATQISAMAVGTSPVGFALFKIAEFVGGKGTVLTLLLGLAILVGFGVIWYFMRNRPKEFAVEMQGEN